MTTTLRFLRAHTATTTAMQAEVLVIIGLLDGNIQIHCQKQLLGLIELSYPAPRPGNLRDLDVAYVDDLQQIFRNFNTRLLELYVQFVQLSSAPKKRRLTLPAAQAKYKAKIKKSLEKALFSAMIVTEGHLKATVKISE